MNPHSSPNETVVIPLSLNPGVVPWNTDVDAPSRFVFSNPQNPELQSWFSSFISDLLLWKSFSRRGGEERITQSIFGWIFRGDHFLKYTRIGLILTASTQGQGNHTPQLALALASVINRIFPKRWENSNCLISSSVGSRSDSLEFRWEHERFQQMHYVIDKVRKLEAQQSKVFYFFQGVENRVHQLRTSREAALYKMFEVCFELGGMKLDEELFQMTQDWEKQHERLEGSMDFDAELFSSTIPQK